MSSHSMASLSAASGKPGHARPSDGMDIPRAGSTYVDEIGKVYADKVRATCAALDAGVSMDTATMVGRCFPKSVTDWELCRRTLYKLLQSDRFLASLADCWERSAEPVKLWNGKMGHRRAWFAPRTPCPHCGGTGFATPIASVQW